MSKNFQLVTATTRGPSTPSVVKTMASATVLTMHLAVVVMNAGQVSGISQTASHASAMAMLQNVMLR